MRWKTFKPSSLFYFNKYFIEFSFLDVQVARTWMMSQIYPTVWQINYFKRITLNWFHGNLLFREANNWSIFSKKANPKLVFIKQT